VESKPHEHGRGCEQGATGAIQLQVAKALEMPRDRQLVCGVVSLSRPLDINSVPVLMAQFMGNELRFP
jgi:hypothetical protein